MARDRTGHLTPVRAAGGCAATAVRRSMAISSSAEPAAVRSRSASSSAKTQPAVRSLVTSAERGPGGTGAHMWPPGTPSSLRSAERRGQLDVDVVRVLEGQDREAGVGEVGDLAVPDAGLGQGGRGALEFSARGHREADVVEPGPLGVEAGAAGRPEAEQRALRRLVDGPSFRPS